MAFCGGGDLSDLIELQKAGGGQAGGGQAGGAARLLAEEAVLSLVGQVAAGLACPAQHSLYVAIIGYQQWEWPQSPVGGQVAAGLAHLHSVRVLHRDLKASWTACRCRAVLPTCFAPSLRC